MHILANENLPFVAVQALRADGHDVAWILEDSPGITDSEVLQRAIAENRVLLTQDKDFGELAFRHGLPAQCGIILVRMPLSPPVDFAARVRTALASTEEWKGHFSVVERFQIRMTPLPR